MVRIPCACHVNGNPSSDMPANVLAMSTKHCACHDFHNVPDSLHLPRNLTFRTSTAEDFLAPAMQHEVHVRKRARTPGKTMPSKLYCDFRDANFVRARAVEINIESQNGILAQTKPPAQSEHFNEHPAFTPTVRTP